MNFQVLCISEFLVDLTTHVEFNERKAKCQNVKIRFESLLNKSVTMSNNS